MNVKSVKLVSNGVFQEEGVTELLRAPGKFPGSSGTRNLHDNLSDLRAQVAANQKVRSLSCGNFVLRLHDVQGILLVRDLIGWYGLDVVQAYMKHIQVSGRVDHTH